MELGGTGGVFPQFPSVGFLAVIDLKVNSMCASVKRRSAITQVEGSKQLMLGLVELQTTLHD